MRPLILTLLIAAVFLPTITFALEPLVPCSGVDCGTCQLIEMGDRILTFFIAVSVTLAAVMFAVGGLTMVTSAGDTGKVGKGKSMMTNAIVGFVIVLAAWLIVDTALKMVLNTGDYGVWNAVSCTAQNAPTAVPKPGGVTAGVPTGTGSVTAVSGSPTLSSQSIQQRINNTNQYANELCAQAAVNGIGDQCSTLRALMGVESNGNPNAVSADGAVGLMQITPDTARSLDPSLAGKSNAEITALLKNPSYNIEIGTKNYATVLNQNNGDTTMALAAYNGGQGANAPSQNCDNVTRWQCAWDDDAHTVPNEGYQETRDYIVNIAEISRQIK